MRDAATCARQSDPDFNLNFRRGYRWDDPARPARMLPVTPKTLEQIGAEIIHFWRAETGRV